MAAYHRDFADLDTFPVFVEILLATSDERRATSDERRATSDERRATSDERRATTYRARYVVMHDGEAHEAEDMESAIAKYDELLSLRSR